MKRTIFLLLILFCSFNIVGTERVISGYCEGRGKILKKDYDSDSLTILATYKSCRINSTKYNNIKVHRTYYKYNKNTKIPTKEIFSSKNIDHDTGNLLIYNTNVEGECEMLH